MFKQSLAVALIAALLFGLVGVPAVAAKSKAEAKAEKEAAQLAKVKTQFAQFGTGPEARLNVKLRDKTKLAGYVSEVKADSFVLTDLKTGTSREISYGDVAQAKGQNLSTGAIIAISIAAGVGITLLVLFILAYAVGD